MTPMLRNGIALAAPALLALTLAACGSKGDLVKPVPSTMPPPQPAQDTTNNGEPTSSQTVSPTAPTPASPKPAQDSGGH